MFIATRSDRISALESSICRRSRKEKTGLGVALIDVRVEDITLHPKHHMVKVKPAPIDHRKRLR